MMNWTSAVCKTNGIDIHYLRTGRYQARASGRLQAEQSSQRFCGECRLWTLCGAEAELLWLQIGDAHDMDGLPVIYDLVSANTDEREAAEVVLQRVKDCDIFGDKGFIGDDWQLRCGSRRAIGSGP